MREQHADKQTLLSLIPPNASSLNFITGAELGLGKAFKCIGAGFTKQYASRQYCIVNNTVDEGLLNVFMPVRICRSLRLSGFIPLGKPFTITKTIHKSGIIREINNQPAGKIYQYYFEEKFDSLRKHNLFGFYPIGCGKGKETKLLTITDYLQDDSLLAIGDCKENETGHIMSLHQPSLAKEIRTVLAPLKESSGGLIFIVNSFSRKKALREYAQKEISLIKQYLGDKFKIIGLYADYFIFPDETTRSLYRETNNILINLWE
jgi:hypothetical protein